jgi:hypothetical protein
MTHQRTQHVLTIVPRIQGEEGSWSNGRIITRWVMRRGEQRNHVGDEGIYEHVTIIAHRHWFGKFGSCSRHPPGDGVGASQAFIRVMESVAKISLRTGNQDAYTSTVTGN